MYQGGAKIHRHFAQIRKIPPRFFVQFAQEPSLTPVRQNAQKSHKKKVFFVQHFVEKLLDILRRWAYNSAIR
jgi:hypothetical protein